MMLPVMMVTARHALVFAGSPGKAVLARGRSSLSVAERGFMLWRGSAEVGWTLAGAVHGLGTGTVATTTVSAISRALP